MDDRATRFAGDSRYDQLKLEREAKRKQYIAQGKITEDTQSLESAVAFRGECLDMCPEFERCERELQFGLDPLEKLAGSDLVDHVRAVKRFRRSAAGDEAALPCDVRPPHILIATLNYLFTDILAQHGLENSYSFVRDRTRAIRKDFTLQNYIGIEAVECHERIARYHIMCMHELCESSNVSLQQEHEQMRKALQSLREYYSDLEKEGIFSPNEGEFQAYYILSHMFQNEFVTRAESLRAEVFRHPLVQLAIEFHHLAQCNNTASRSRPITEGSINAYSRFFRCVAAARVPYLFACVLHLSFVSIRKGALKAMQVAYYCFPDKRDYIFQIHELVPLLGFDTAEEAVKNLDYYEIPYQKNGVECNVYIGKIRPGKESIGMFKEDQRASYLPKRSERLLIGKRQGMTDVDILNGAVIQSNGFKMPAAPFLAPVSNGLSLGLKKESSSAVSFGFNTVSSVSSSFQPPVSNTLQTMRDKLTNAKRNPASLQQSKAVVQPVIQVQHQQLSNIFNSIQPASIIPQTIQSNSHQSPSEASLFTLPMPDLPIQQSLVAIPTISEPTLVIQSAPAPLKKATLVLTDSELWTIFAPCITPIVTSIAHSVKLKHIEQTKQHTLNQTIQLIAMQISAQVISDQLSILANATLSLKALKDTYESVAESICKETVMRLVFKSSRTLKSDQFHDSYSLYKSFTKWRYVFEARIAEKQHGLRKLQLLSQIGSNLSPVAQVRRANASIEMRADIYGEMRNGVNEFHGGSDDSVDLDRLFTDLRGDTWKLCVGMSCDSRNAVDAYLKKWVCTKLGISGADIRERQAVSYGTDL